MTNRSYVIGKNLAKDKNITAKWCVAFDPNGLVTFISNIYQDCSDVQLLQKCGILDLVQLDDTILTRNELPGIEMHMKRRGVKLVMPQKLSSEPLENIVNLLDVKLNDVRSHMDH